MCGAGCLPVSLPQSTDPRVCSKKKLTGRPTAQGDSPHTHISYTICAWSIQCNQ
nr:MAG TPA: hypothetical protein [Caudoviricetes sp.]